MPKKEKQKNKKIKPARGAPKKSGSVNLKPIKLKSMDKVKIKRVKRNKKEITAKEKILAGIGLGSSILGGVGSFTPSKTGQTAFVRSTENQQAKNKGKVSDLLNKVFGATLGVAQAKAATVSELEEAYNQASQALDAFDAQVDQWNSELNGGMWGEEGSVDYESHANYIAEKVRDERPGLAQAKTDAYNAWKTAQELDPGKVVDPNQNNPPEEPIDEDANPPVSHEEGDDAGQTPQGLPAVWHKNADGLWIKVEAAGQRVLNPNGMYYMSDGKGGWTVDDVQNRAKPDSTYKYHMNSDHTLWILDDGQTDEANHPGQITSGGAWVRIDSPPAGTHYENEPVNLDSTGNRKGHWTKINGSWTAVDNAGNIVTDANGVQWKADGNNGWIKVESSSALPPVHQENDSAGYQNGAAFFWHFIGSTDAQKSDDSYWKELVKPGEKVQNANGLYYTAGISGNDNTWTLAGDQAGAAGVSYATLNRLYGTNYSSGSFRYQNGSWILEGQANTPVHTEKDTENGTLKTDQGLPGQWHQKADGTWVVVEQPGQRIAGEDGLYRISDGFGGWSISSNQYDVGEKTGQVLNTAYGTNSYDANKKYKFISGSWQVVDDSTPPVLQGDVYLKNIGSGNFPSASFSVNGQSYTFAYLNGHLYDQNGQIIFDFGSTDTSKAPSTFSLQQLQSITSSLALAKNVVNNLNGNSVHMSYDQNAQSWVSTPMENDTMVVDETGKANSDSTKNIFSIVYKSGQWQWLNGPTAQTKSRVDTTGGRSVHQTSQDNGNTWKDAPQVGDIDYITVNNSSPSDKKFKVIVVSLEGKLTWVLEDNQTLHTTEGVDFVSSAGHWVQTTTQPLGGNVTIAQIQNYLQNKNFADTPWNQLSSEDLQNFNTIFSNGQHQELVPVTFSSSSAFAYALGLGGKAQDATTTINGKTYKFDGNYWTIIYQTSDFVASGSKTTSGIDISGMPIYTVDASGSNNGKAKATARGDIVVWDSSLNEGSGGWRDPQNNETFTDDNGIVYTYNSQTKKWSTTNVDITSLPAPTDQTKPGQTSVLGPNKIAVWDVAAKKWQLAGPGATYSENGHSYVMNTDLQWVDITVSGTPVVQKNSDGSFTLTYTGTLFDSTNNPRSGQKFSLTGSSQTLLSQVQALYQNYLAGRGGVDLNTFTALSGAISSVSTGIGIDTTGSGVVKGAEISDGVQIYKDASGKYQLQVLTGLTAIKNPQTGQTVYNLILNANSISELKDWLSKALSNNSGLSSLVDSSMIDRFAALDQSGQMQFTFTGTITASGVTTSDGSKPIYKPTQDSINTLIAMLKQAGFSDAVDQKDGTIKFTNSGTVLNAGLVIETIQTQGLSKALTSVQADINEHTGNIVDVNQAAISYKTDDGTIHSDSSLSGKVGKMSFITFSWGNNSPVSWSVSSGSLPAGLTLSPSGILSGTATAADNYSFTIKATVGSGASAKTLSHSYRMSISPSSSVVSSVSASITTASQLSGTVNQMFSQTFAQTNLSYPIWTITSGELPSGLSLNSSTGVISGIPKAAGSYGFTLQATEANNPAVFASKSFILNIAGTQDQGSLQQSSTLSFTVSDSSVSLTTGQDKTVYAEALLPSGGQQQLVSVTVSSSNAQVATASVTTPPGGGQNGSTITIHGVSVGTATIRIHPNNLSANDTSQDKLVTITVTSSPASSANTTLDASTAVALNSGTVNKAYSSTFNNSSYTNPVWSLTNGKLPDGLSLNTSNGAITGTPTTVGTFIFALQVSQAGNIVGKGVFSITINAAAQSATGTGSSTSTSSTGTGSSTGSATSSTTGSTSKSSSGSVSSPATSGTGASTASGTYSSTGSTSSTSTSTTTTTSTTAITLTSINCFNANGVNSNGVIMPGYTIEINGTGLSAYSNFYLIVGSQQFQITRSVISNNKITLTIPTLSGVSNNSAAYIAIISSKAGVSSGTITNLALKYQVPVSTSSSGGLQMASDTGEQIDDSEGTDTSGGETVDTTSGSGAGTEVVSGSTTTSTTGGSITLNQILSGGGAGSGGEEVETDEVLDGETVDVGNDVIDGLNNQEQTDTSEDIVDTGIGMLTTDQVYASQGQSSGGGLTYSQAQAGQTTSSGQGGTSTLTYAQFLEQLKTSGASSSSATGTSTAFTMALPAGTVNSAYSQALNLGGLTNPVITLSSGALPSGLSLNTASGTISGVPKDNGNYTFTIKISSGQNTVTLNCSLTINLAASIGSGSGGGGSSSTTTSSSSGSGGSSASGGSYSGGGGVVINPTALSYSQLANQSSGLQMPGYTPEGAANSNRPTGLAMPAGYSASGSGSGEGLQMPTEYLSEQSVTDSQANSATTLGSSYTVKKGDTLWKIAKQFYGDGSKWRVILQANTKALAKAGNTKTLKVGVTLTIPSSSGSASIKTTSLKSSSAKTTSIKTANVKTATTKTASKTQTKTSTNSTAAKSLASANKTSAVTNPAIKTTSLTGSESQSNNTQTKNQAQSQTSTQNQVNKTSTRSGIQTANPNATSAQKTLKMEDLKAQTQETQDTESASASNNGGSSSSGQNNNSDGEEVTDVDQ